MAIEHKLYRDILLFASQNKIISMKIKHKKTEDEEDKSQACVLERHGVEIWSAVDPARAICETCSGSDKVLPSSLSFSSKNKIIIFQQFLIKMKKTCFCYTLFSRY